MNQKPHIFKSKGVYCLAVYHFQHPVTGARIFEVLAESPTIKGLQPKKTLWEKLKNACNMPKTGV